MTQPAAAPAAAVGRGGARGEAWPPDEVGEQGEVEAGRVERVATSWSWAQGQGQRDTGTSCGQGMDRLGPNPDPDRDLNPNPNPSPSPNPNPNPNANPSPSPSPIPIPSPSPNPSPSPSPSPTTTPSPSPDEGMDRLGLLLCSSSTSSCNSCDAFVPSALHAQQQEQLATMREPLSRRRAPGAGGAGASERPSE